MMRVCLALYGALIVCVGVWFGLVSLGGVLGLTFTAIFTLFGAAVILAGRDKEDES